MTRPVTTPAHADDARRLYLRAYQLHRDEPIAVTMADVVRMALDALEREEAARVDGIVCEPRPRWISMDGSLHTAGGNCPSCSGPWRDARCRTCGAKLHRQAIYGGIAEACESCDSDWDSGPMPTHRDGTIEQAKVP